MADGRFAEASFDINSSVLCSSEGLVSPDVTVAVRRGVWSQQSSTVGQTVWVADGFDRWSVDHAFEGRDAQGALFIDMANNLDPIHTGLPLLEERMRDTVALVAAAAPAGVAATVRCREVHSNRLVQTQTDGLRLISSTASTIRIDAQQGDGPAVRRSKATLSSLDGLNAVEPGELRSLVERSLEQEARLRAADPPPIGVFPVVLSPKATGIFTHEVVGHLLESDNLQLDGSPLLDSFGVRVAIDEVSVFDDGTDLSLWGGRPFDDEGVATRRIDLISDGILTGALQSRDSKSGPSLAPTGNGRRASYRHHVLPRMTQTGMAPGNAVPADMVGSVSRGVYVTDIAWARVSPSSGAFRLMMREGRMIEGSELSTPFAGGVLSGDAVSALTSIEAVGSDFEWAPALCIKQNQEVTLSSGGPTVLLGSHSFE